MRSNKPSIIHLPNSCFDRGGYLEVLPLSQLEHRSRPAYVFGRDPVHRKSY